MAKRKTNKISPTPVTVRKTRVVNLSTVASIRHQGIVKSAPDNNSMENVNKDPRVQEIRDFVTHLNPDEAYDVFRVNFCGGGDSFDSFSDAVFLDIYGNEYDCTKFENSKDDLLFNVFEAAYIDFNNDYKNGTISIYLKSLRTSISWTVASEYYDEDNDNLESEEEESEDYIYFEGLVLFDDKGRKKVDDILGSISKLIEE